MVGLSLAPFLLQFLGLGLSEEIGQGLCGSALGVSEAEAVKYGLVSEYYFYGQLFLASWPEGHLRLAHGPPPHVPRPGPSLRPLAVAARGGPFPGLLLLFLLTRTLPLPFATPLGLAFLSPAPLDPLSLLMVLPEPFLLWLLWRYRP